MVEQKPWLDWQQHMDPETLRPLDQSGEDVIGLDTSEISPLAAGSGLGALAAVPALLLIFNWISPANLSEGELVSFSLLAPIVGGCLGAIGGWAVTRLVQRLNR